MKKKLPLRPIILCMILLPFISTAQKQFSHLKITSKQHVNFKTINLNSTTAAISDVEKKIISNKLSQRFILSQERTTNSPLMLSKLSGHSYLDTDKSSSNEKIAAGSPPPINDFKGLKDNGTVYPPDPGGAAGPKYVMHVTNQKYVVYNKSGSVALSLPVDTFWSGFSATALAFAYPHVEYDAQLQHFYIATLAEDLATNDYAILFGSSDTNDPTGSWTLYEFDLGPEFIQDAPQIGYSKRWFTITTVQYDTAAPNNFNSAGIYLMSLSDLIGGTLSQIFFVNDVNFFSMSPVETMDVNINNHYLVTNLGSSADTGFLYVVHIGGTLTAPSYNYDGYVTKNKPWSSTPVFAPQNGTTKKIYAGSTKLTNAVYRNGQIWTSHTVYLPETTPTRAAVQWWQIKVSSLIATQFARVEDKTGTIMYGYPSLSVNKHNDMLLGYNKFSPSIYASAAYSYRNGSDALNKLRGSYTYKDGKSVYFAGGASGVTYNWGSYTSTSVDPVDSSFWTIQEYAEKPADTWGTWWAHVDNVTAPGTTSPVAAKGSESRSLIIISPNPAKNIAAISWSEEKAAPVKIQISNAQGNILLAKEFNAQKGNNRLSVNVAGIISGVYTVAVFNGTDIKKAQIIIQ